MCLEPPVFFGFKLPDFALAVHDDAHGNTLHTPGGEPGLHLAPEQGREFVANGAVKDAPGLLRVHELLVQLAGIPEGVEDRRFCDLVKNDTLHRTVIQPQRCDQVPGDGFPFAVFVGCKEDGGVRADGLAERLDDLLLVLRDLVLWFEVFCRVKAKVAFWQVTNMSHRGGDGVIRPKELPDGPGLGRRFDDDQVF